MICTFETSTGYDVQHNGQVAYGENIIESSGFLNTQGKNGCGNELYFKTLYAKIIYIIYYINVANEPVKVRTRQSANRSGKAAK